MASRDSIEHGEENPFIPGLRGGFTQTPPWGLYVGTALAVIWDMMAFVHWFHVSFPGSSANVWWPLAWLFLALIVVGWSRGTKVSTPWWAWALLGIGVLAVSAATDGTALSLWGALVIAVWPRQGHPWWIALAGLAMLHALIQWGFLMSAWHLPTFVSLGLLWVTGLGLLVSARGSNWHTPR